MRMLRTTLVNGAFSLLTGMLFLNMSFFLAEVSALKMGKNKQLFENISRLLSGTSAEEEQDAFASASDEDTFENEVDLLLTYSTYPPLAQILTPRHDVNIWKQGIPLIGIFEIDSPPPEA